VQKFETSVDITQQSTGLSRRRFNCTSAVCYGLPASGDGKMKRIDEIIERVIATPAGDVVELTQEEYTELVSNNDTAGIWLSSTDGDSDELMGRKIRILKH
jgi:hypothetical protein